MATILPYARLVVLLREPAERFRSNLKMELCRAGAGSMPPINVETHLLNEGFFVKGRFDEYLHSHHNTLGHVQRWCSISGSDSSYARLWRCLALRSTMMPLARGLYFSLLEHWLDVFVPSSFYIIQSEAFFAAPGKTLADLLQFFGMPSNKFDLSPEAVKSIRQPRGMHCSNTAGELDDAILGYLPLRSIQLLRHFYKGVPD